MLTLGVWEGNGQAAVIAHFHVLRRGAHLVWYNPSIRLVPIVSAQHSRFNPEIAGLISVQVHKHSSIDPTSFTPLRDSLNF